MSVKEITGLMTILPDKENPKSSNKEDLQAGNIAFRSRTLARTINFWDTNSAGQSYQMRLYPFKQGGLLDDNDITVGHADWAAAQPTAYPVQMTAISTLDYLKFRATGSIAAIASSAISRVHAGISAYDNTVGVDKSAWGGDSLVSASDLPADYTQIGIVYAHPMYLAGGAANSTLTTLVGRDYVTFTNAGFWDNKYVTPGRWQVLRIATGADAGFYFIQHVDFANNKLWLRNLNGTPFVGQAAATIAGNDLYIGPGRTTYFNEISIIPLSAGQVETSGRFQPGFFAGTTQPIRSSFIMKVKIEKTGSTEVAAAAEQQGSYTIGMKPWTHGDYDQGLGYDFALYKNTVNEGGSANFPGHTFPYTSTGAGGANAMVLDEANQRCWIGHTNANNDSCIMHWRWRTIESPREVANYLGTAGHSSFLSPPLVLASGDRIRGGTQGTGNWVYFAVQHPSLGNGGVIIIKPDLTTRQYTEDQGGAAWTGTGDTIGGTAPSMTLTDAGAVFNARMVGQSITISGATTGANDGTFLITGYTSPTVITYQNHAGVAEAFTGTWTRLGVPDSNVAGIVADKTANRAFAGDTVGASNQIDNIVGTTMTSSDIGRVIRVAGADAGIYKIATVVDADTITVTTLAGDAVTFGGDGGIDLDIGDRLYMFYDNATTGLNKINYFESLAPGTFLNRTFSSTAGLGADCNVQAIHGENQRVAIDPANGDVYWLSNDTTQQINKYNVATNAHTAILITDTNVLTTPGSVLVGGTAATSVNPATPTSFNAILVNSKFDEIWVGSDNGHLKIVKSTFAPATMKRYWGAENTAYWAGPPLTTGTGSASTALTYSAPNMTLNATGTPFVASDVGKYIVITGSSTAGNNGVFPITAFNSSSQIVYNNNTGATMATQANYAGTFFIVSSYAPRSDGSYSPQNSRITRNFFEHPDGRVQTQLWAGSTGNVDTAYYSREADTFVWRDENVSNQTTGSTGRNKVFDSVGWFLDLSYGAWNAGPRMWLGAVEVTYQWTGSAWTPREVALAGTPNKSFADTTNPLCAAKPIHSAHEEVMYGVKIGFYRQGILVPATPANNEFLGRMAQVRVTSSGGGTTTGSAVFTDGGFVSGDAGRTLRIETGTDAGIYKINVVTPGVSVTLKTMAGATFSALATAGSLTYTVWDYGSVGSNAGPEEMTIMLADGVGKDNTQDITGFTYEAYHFKTRLHENDEPRKFATANPLAVPGSLASKVYFENYPEQTGQYDAALAHHRALPAAELTNGRQILDGIIGKRMDGVVGHGTAYSNTGSDTGWNGITANTVLGYSLMVDFGKDVQVGYAVLRVHTFSAEARIMNTLTSCGLIGNIYKATDAGGTPLGSATKSGVGNGTTGLSFSTPTMTLNATGTPFVAGDVGKYIVITGASVAANNGTFTITAFNSSSSISYTNASGATQNNYAATWFVVPTPGVRTSGAGTFNCTANVANTNALLSGDFLGAISLTPTTPAVGLITSGGNTLTDTTNAQFLASHVGQVVELTAGAGAESTAPNNAFRVIGYTSPSVITVQNLDQTAKTWTLSSAVVTYRIKDAVREEDMIVVANGGHRLCVERLLTPTTMQLRIPPNALITNQSWICVKPTWDLVKRISYSADAAPPDVKNNGTWLSGDGREIYSNQDVKVYSDFSDLSSSARTGRYWKWTAIPRFATDSGRADHDISTWEFYDVAGNRLATSKNTVVDEARTNADFLFNHINRADFIQSANDAMTGVSGVNGNVDLGGANGDTLTLTTGGNKFLGFQVGPTKTDGNPINGGNTFNSAGSDFPASATPGRFLWVQDGTNAGYYRILSRVSATQITVGPPSGTGSTLFSPTETGRTFSIHEGISVGGVSPDKIVFLGDLREFTLATINDSLTTMTIAESLQPVRANRTWEIRRPAYDTASATTEATKTARLTRPGNTVAGDTGSLGTYPVQTGDLCHDSRGTFRLFSEDIGSGFQRADGVIAGGNGVLTGTGFTSDDVGRLLYIVSGVNTGIYEIQTYSSSTSITVKNHYDGTAVSFTADAGPVTYQIYGDRRFRLTRFVVGLRA